MRRPTSIPARAALAAAVPALLAGALLVPRPTPVSADVAADRAAAARVRAAVAAESRRIEATREGLAAAERRLAELTAREARRRAQFLAAQEQVVQARIRLSRLERRQAQARDALAGNLVAAYQEDRPDLMTIVLEADGFREAIERLEFEQRTQRQNRNVIDATREAQGDAEAQERRLARQERRFQQLARAAADDRDQANAVRTALARREARQLARRAGSQSRLTALNRRIRGYEQEQIASARRAADASSATSEAPAANGGDVVSRVIQAANAIARTPYVWGGGHGGNAGGYDCSGSISYALAAGGLLDSPLASGGFMSWGEPGPGRRITVYANAGHAYMVVDGRRYDTSALRSGGTRWTSQMRSSAGFVARHPKGF